jgi:hypothetical protein
MRDSSRTGSVGGGGGDGGAAVLVVVEDALSDKGADGGFLFGPLVHPPR